MSVGELLVTTISGLGGAAIAAAILAKGLGKVLADGIQQQWKHVNDKALEGLRAELSQHNQLFSAALSARSSESLVAQDRRVKAAEALWEHIITMRTTITPILFLYMLLDPSEYKKAFDLPTARAIPTFDEFMHQMQFKESRIETHRPFFGEKAWVAFWVYRAVLGRLATRVVMAAEKGKPLPIWYQDDDGKPEHAVSVAKRLLGEEPVNSAIAAGGNGVQMLIELIEQKVLIEIDQRISGFASAQLTVAEGVKLADMLADAQKVIGRNRS